MRERQHINVDEVDEETLDRMFDVKGQERRMDIAEGTWRGDKPPDDDDWEIE
jgi:hypothetical protein